MHRLDPYFCPGGTSGVMLMDIWDKRDSLKALELGVLDPSIHRLSSKEVQMNLLTLLIILIAILLIIYLAKRV